MLSSAARRILSCGNAAIRSASARNVGVMSMPRPEQAFEHGNPAFPVTLAVSFPVTLAVPFPVTLVVALAMTLAPARLAFDA